MLATNNPSPFDLKLRLQRESEAEENRRRDAERAELLAHEDQFITISEIGRAIVESGREGYTGNLWQAIHDTLKDEPEAVIFCHWEGEERWTPLPSPDVCPAVVGAGHTVEPAARFGREPMKGPIGYYIGGCFIATGDSAAFAIRRDLAGRLFGLPEPAGAPHEAIATPTPAPSASAPTVAAPEPTRKQKKPRRSWWDDIVGYLAEVWRKWKGGSAKDFYRELESRAGSPDSPLEKTKEGLRVRSCKQSIAMHTMETRLKLVKAAAGMG